MIYALLKALGGFGFILLSIAFIILIIVKSLSRKRIREIFLTCVFDFKPTTAMLDISSWDNYVYPHSALTQLAPNLYVVRGNLPPKGPQLPRNMIIYKLPGTKEVWLYSVICCNESVQTDIEKLGEIKYIVVPNDHHRIDLLRYKNRYPRASVVSSRYDCSRVADITQVDLVAEEIWPNDYIHSNNTPIRSFQPSGTYNGELAYELTLESVGDTTTTRAWIFCDLIFNMAPGEGGIIPKLMGSSGFFGVTRLGLNLGVNDLFAFADWCRGMCWFI